MQLVACSMENSHCKISKDKILFEFNSSLFSQIYIPKKSALTQIFTSLQR